MQWSWGLDANHDNGGTPVDHDMQQATVNLLADMGAQPATLQSGLVAASVDRHDAAHGDHHRRRRTARRPSVGKPVTVTGTATDTGGGVVAGVEVSTDDGTTWHRASGTGSWTYTWTPPEHRDGDAARARHRRQRQPRRRPRRA